MEMVKTNNFTEMSACEMQQTDGGLVILGITITIGKAIGVGLTLIGAGCFIYGVSTH